jgi:hypothetical protein
MTMTYAKVAVNTSESVPFASNRGGACIDAVQRRGLVAVGVEIKNRAESEWESHDCSEAARACQQLCLAD